MDAEPRRELAPSQAARAEADVGGDPACWAGLICPNCGAMPDQLTDARGRAAVCPRCGEPYPAD